MFNTDELYRLVLNVYISKSMGYINDSVRINKIHNRLITHRESRILCIYEITILT